MSTFFAKFEKVSFEQFKKDYCNYMRTFGRNCKDAVVKEVYDNIKLPTRSTQASAGYDFYLPASMPMHSGKCTVPIPTGIRCSMTEANVLLMMPRSGMSMKFGTRLINTVGVIDADYFFADNEGHILLMMVCDREGQTFDAGTKFAQGVITHYCLAEEDPVEESRTGGFGSTDNANGVSEKREYFWPHGPEDDLNF